MQGLMDKTEWLRAYDTATELIDVIRYCAEHGAEPTESEIRKLESVKEFLRGLYLEEHGA